MTLRGCIFVLLFTVAVLAADGSEQIQGPSSPDVFLIWWNNITNWKQSTLRSIKYDDSIYNIPKLSWTQSSFVQPQVMIHDRYLYDPIKQQYTVDKYLDDLVERYGGIDSVLVWHSYPNIGVDDRNQFDMLKDLPGGLDGVRQLVSDFHKRGVRVLFPYNPWDRGTRDSGAPDSNSLNEVIAHTGADGFNGDTMREIARDFFQDKNPIAIEPELGPTPVTLQWCKLGWGYWNYDFMPSVCKYKWLENRHMTHLCNRWARDHTDGLQFSFFNGIGFESWENVWGIWNQINKRDGQAMKQIFTLSRHFSDLLVQNWVPHYKTRNSDSVFASRFGTNQRLWTLVNRGNKTLTGEQLQVAHDSTRVYFDVYHGVKLVPKIQSGIATLSFEMEALGLGAILSIQSKDVNQELLNLLKVMQALTKEPLSHYSQDPNILQQTIVPMEKISTGKPYEMQYIPEAKQWKFESYGLEIEGRDYDGVDFQYSILNETYPRLNHAGLIDIPEYFIDMFAVSNEKYHQFMIRSGYKPKDPRNFLKHWKDGTFIKGHAYDPVIYVSIDDARAYCKFYGSRLPHEWEWQRAMQGDDGRKYPWGNEYNSSLVPVPDTNRTMRGPDWINAHPNAASPFGLTDGVGNVWQWTDEYYDDHTRAAVLKGGCYYSPQGSKWYFPQQKVELRAHGKYLLMDESLDRSACISFRCVSDIKL
jgi:hypothetical protein